MSAAPLPNHGFGLALLYIGACFAWTVLVVLPFLLLVFGDDLTSPLALAASALGMSGGAAAIGGGIRRARRWTVEETWAVRRPTLTVLAWCGALLGALSLGTIGEAIGTAWWELLSERFGLELSTDALAAIAEGLLAGAASHRAVFAVVVVLFGPVLEELVFRGFLWRLLRGDERPWTALIGTSLLFAGWHLDPIQSVGVLPLAIFLGVLRWRSGSLLPAVAVHILNNALALAAILGGMDAPTSLLWLVVAGVAGTVAFVLIGRRSPIG